jgi:hypothetical protein
MNNVRALLLSILPMVLGCDHSRDNASFLLTGDEYNQLFASTISEMSPSQSIHFFYSEVFNDSTSEIEFYLSEISYPDTISDINRLKYNDTDVFIYASSPSFNYADSEISKKVKALKFTPDLPYWHLLIKRREKSIIIREVSFYINPSMRMDVKDDDIGNF